MQNITTIADELVAAQAELESACARRRLTDPQQNTQAAQDTRIAAAARRYAEAMKAALAL